MNSMPASDVSLTAFERLGGSPKGSALAPIPEGFTTSGSMPTHRTAGITSAASMVQEHQRREAAANSRLTAMNAVKDQALAKFNAAAAAAKAAADAAEAKANAEMESLNALLTSIGSFGSLAPLPVTPPAPALAVMPVAPVEEKTPTSVAEVKKPKSKKTTATAGAVAVGSWADQMAVTSASAAMPLVTSSVTSASAVVGEKTTTPDADGFTKVEVKKHKGAHFTLDRNGYEAMRERVETLLDGLVKFVIGENKASEGKRDFSLSSQAEASPKNYTFWITDDKKSNEWRFIGLYPPTLKPADKATRITLTTAVMLGADTTLPEELSFLKTASAPYPLSDTLLEKARTQMKEAGLAGDVGIKVVSLDDSLRCGIEVTDLRRVAVATTSAPAVKSAKPAKTSKTFATVASGAPASPASASPLDVLKAKLVAAVTVSDWTAVNALTAAIQAFEAKP